MTRAIPAFCVLLCAAACTKTAEKPPDTGGSPPPLNYIPANEGKCSLAETPSGIPQATQTLLALNANAAQVGDRFQLCPAAAADGECAPCETNGLRDYLAALDAKQTGGGIGFVQYFKNALAYPLRHVVVVEAQGEQKRYYVVQASRNACAPGELGCRSYNLEPESLENDCRTPTHALDVATTTPAEGSLTEVTSASKHDFSFYVPLVDRLPELFPTVGAEAAEGGDAVALANDDGSGCPDVDAVHTEDGLHRFLMCHPALRISVATPTLKVLRTDANGSCGYLTGLVDANSLPADARAALDTADYEDPDAPGFLPVTLSFRLLDGTFSVSVPESDPQEVK